MSRLSVKRLLLATALLVGGIVLVLATQLGMRLWHFHTLFDPERITQNFRSMPTIFQARPIPKGPVSAPCRRRPRRWWSASTSRAGTRPWVTGW